MNKPKSGWLLRATIALIIGFWFVGLVYILVTNPKPGEAPGWAAAAIGLPILALVATLVGWCVWWVIGIVVRWVWYGVDS